MSDSKHMMQFKINHLFRKVQSKDDEIERFSKYIAELEDNNKQVRTDLLLYVDSNVELHATNERLRAENDAWQNQDLLEQSNRQADEIERLQKHVVACSDTCSFQAREIERLRADVDKAIELLREGSTKFGEYGDTFMQAGMLNLADALKEDEG